jgi:diguanylate cyclase (GGDEF)-like protein
LYVHCINRDPEVIEAVKSLNGIKKVTKDTAFETAVHWSAKDMEEKPDIIFCDEFAVNTRLDVQSGEINRDKIVLNSLKEIKFNLPETRIIILLEKRREHDEKFLQHLISLAVYDFHFVDSFDVEDLERMLLFEKPRTLKDVAEYVAETDYKKGSQTEVQQAEKESLFKKTEVDKRKKAPAITERFKMLAEKAGRLFKNRLPKREDKGTSVTRKLPEEIVENTENVLVETVDFSAQKAILSGKTDAKKTEPDMLYYYGPTEEENLKTIPEVVAFSTWENFLVAVKTAVPDAVIINAAEDRIEEKIKYLRRDKRLLDVPLAVIGNEKVTGDIYLEKLDKNAVEKIKAFRRSLCRVWEKASDEAARDPLTGLYNRRFLEKYLESITGKYSVLLCDLDHFKKVNDTYGHSAGDEVLIKFAEYLRESTRKTDVLFRYGGEEFLIIFPHTSKPDAESTAEYLRKGWQKKEIYNSTFSGGIAEHPTDGTPKEVIEAADKALYNSKKAGRNMISVSGKTKKTDTRLFKLKPVNEYQTCVYIVAGAAPGVGATGFSLALAKYLSKKGCEVEIIDAGGGASKWLNSRSGIPVRKAPPYSICPGCFTIIDAGEKIPEEIRPLVNDIFVVTDLSRKAIELKRFNNSGAYLVGNRGAPLDALKELASLWGLSPFGVLPEEKGIKMAEIKGEIFLPKSWIRHLKKIM